MLKLIFAILILFTVSQSIQADDIVIDTTNGTIDADSLLPYDSLIIVSDTLIPYDSLNINPDTLSAAQKAYLRFQIRQEKHKQKKVTTEVETVRHYFSYDDSLAQYFLSPRLNQKKVIDRSLYRDAGDYFIHDPSYFVIDYQPSPKRKIVAPFGVTGDRIGFIYNGMTIEPFEHLVTPDNMTDLNDIPTALDDEVYVLAGPFGSHFGSYHKLASLITMPTPPHDYNPQSAILHDRGSFGYNFTRGSYSRQFTNNRQLDLSLEYRNAQGLFLGKEDSYNYTGSTYMPLSPNYSLRASGYFSSRQSAMKLFDQDPNILWRNRLERYSELAFERNKSSSAKQTIGYRYHHSNANLDNLYKSRLDNYSNDFFAKAEWVSGKTFYRVELTNNYQLLNNGLKEINRNQTAVSFNIFKAGQFSSWVLSSSIATVKDYKTLPELVASYQYEKGNTFIQISTGYSEKAPSLYELNLPDDSTRALVNNQYYSSLIIKNQSNSKLKKEKMISLGAIIEKGDMVNNLRLSFTSGKIKDAIQWTNEVKLNNLGTTYIAAYEPHNSDLTFIDSKLSGKLKLSDKLNWHGGAAYHYVDDSSNPNNPYQPDYQLFAGAEFHVVWKQKLMDLYAYGEFRYTGSYLDQWGGQLGQDPIFNAKFSFGIKKFRMHFAFQNILSQPIQAYEGITYPGRYSYFGIIWAFTD